jgi:hypothetical protein
MSSMYEYSSQQEHYGPPIENSAPPPQVPDKTSYYHPQSPASAPEVASNQFGLYHPQPQQPQRTLSPTLSQGSTNIGSPNLGSIWSPETEGKEVIQTSVQNGPPAQQKRRICGLSRLVFWILLVILLLLAIGLGAGLGAGLGMKHSNKQ